MALTSPASTVFDGVLPLDVGALDGEQAAAALADLRALRGFLDGFEAKLTARIAALHAAGQSAPAADVHASCGTSAKEARRKERRSKTLDEAPALADQLSAGAITAEHADALADATCRLDDDTRAAVFDHDAELAADASRMSPEQFAANCRDLIRVLERDQGIERDRQQRRETRLSKRIDRDGMYVLNARLHPELGNAVFNAIDAETAALVKQGGDRSVDRSHIAAEALGNLVTGGHQAVRPVEAEVRVHVDAATLLDGPHADSVCEYDDGTPLPPATVRRMVCNGRIVPIVIDTHGVTLNAGREQRLANRHQRRALRAMYRTCAHPGCDVAFSRCEMHHITPWERGGHSDLDQLLPLCSRHHHVVHEMGLVLSLDDRRTLTIRWPDGRPHSTTPLRPPPSDAGAHVSTAPAGQLRLSA